jgi:TonB family protein
MATRAFLLCGDEKAVQAVTQILDELEVSFEHSSEPAFSLKRLATQRFDLLIVDCDNVQNATQVFNSARASNLNKTSIAIAIVEGKAGVPNAFRLGASLVLTKPVALEQVRNTLRTGIGMTRKEAPEVKAPAATVSAVVPPPTAASLTPTAVVVPRSAPATVAPTAAVASPAANRPVATPSAPAVIASAPPAPTPVRPATAPIPETVKVTIAAPPAPAKPVVAAPSANPSALAAQEKKPAVTPFNKPKSEPTAGTPAVAKAAAAAAGTSTSVKNFDAVFATPPVTEKSDKTKGIDSKSDWTNLSAEESKEAASPVLSIVDPLAEEEALDPVKDHGVPSFGALGTQRFAGLESTKRTGGKGWLIAALVLVVLGGGTYGAWLTQPGFRKVAASEYLNVMGKTGAVPVQPQTAAAVEPPTPTSAAAPVAASAPAPTPDGQTADANMTATPNPTAAMNATSASSATSSSISSAQPAPSAANAAPKTAAVQVAKQDTTPTHAGASPSLVTASAPVPQPTAAKMPSSDLLEVPEDYADDQVVHRVHPAYPKQARARRLHGTVVLQAVINKQGKVDSLQLVSGDPLLAQAAADAVKQWRYKPYWHNGEAADFQTRISVDFKQP